LMSARYIPLEMLFARSFARTRTRSIPLLLTLAVPLACSAGDAPPPGRDMGFVEDGNNQDPDLGDPSTGAPILVQEKDVIVDKERGAPGCGNGILTEDE